MLDHLIDFYDPDTTFDTNCILPAIFLLKKRKIKKKCRRFKGLAAVYMLWIPIFKEKKKGEQKESFACYFQKGKSTNLIN
jgi:hypothetical protein